MDIFNRFINTFKQITTVIAFDPKWANGTGYLDHAVKADLGLRPGDIAKSTDNDDRRIIFIGTRFGNVVLFERYSPTKTTLSFKVVGNYPSALRGFYAGSMGIGTALTDEGLEHLVDKSAPDKYNIGTALEELFSS